MRIKKDTILKWFLLSETMHLSHEEFGLIIRNVMMDDDKHGIRYEDINNEYILNKFKEKEDVWKQEFYKLLAEKPIVISSVSTITKQVTHSHKSFLEKQKYYEMQDKKEEQKLNNNVEVPRIHNNADMPKNDNIEYSECELNKDIVSVLNPFTNEFSEYEETENYLLKYYKFKDKEVGIYGHMAIMPNDENFEDITRNLTNEEMSSILKNIEIDGGLCQELEMYIKSFEDEETPF